MTNIGYETISRSIKIILTSGLGYQLRTTLVPTIHNRENVLLLAKELAALAEEEKINPRTLVWHLQNFRPQNCLEDRFTKMSPFSGKEFGRLVSAAQSILPQATG